MDSLKSIVVVAILLGVLYGIYQVINDDQSLAPADASPNLLADFDSDEGSTNPSPEAPEEKSTANSETEATLESNLKPPPSGFNPADTETQSKSVDNTTTTTQPPSSSFPFPERQADRSEPTSDNEATPPIGSNNRASFVGSSDTQPPPNNSNPANAFEGANVRPSQFSPNSESGNTSNFASTRDTQPENASRNVRTNATSTAKDTRDRFFKGSYAEFTQRVSLDMKRAEDLIKADRFVDALRLLTKFYDDPRLTQEENNNLMSWLDPLAGKVIYSVEHHLTDAYFVKHSDTLNLLSAKYSVPPELIFNINRVKIPNQKQLVAGTELKMVKGPFHVEVNLSKKIMTLFLGDVYAGTFPVRIGTEPSPRPGKYRVLSKSRLGQDYNDKNYQRIAAQSANNPYGDFFLSLGNGMSIHSSAKLSDSTDLRGCISLNAVDAEDIHNILTTESTVIIVE